MFSSKALKTYMAVIIALSIAAFALTSCAGRPGAQRATSPQSSASSVSSDAPSSTAASSSKATALASQPSKAASSSASPSKVSSAPPKNAAEYVTLTIDASRGQDGIVVNAKKVEIKSGDTVYSLLKRYCAENKILLSVKTTGTVYVESIDGVAEFDFGAQSGWLYGVNGKFPKTNCGAYTLAGGETVKWIYTTDLGKSEGADK